MLNYKDRLDKDQYQAVVSKVNGNKICIASAGTGKTYTLTHRIAYLIEQGINPGNIMLLTFTNKAAETMIRRTTSLLQESNIENADKMKIMGGTFHNIAITLFYKYYVRIHPDMSNFQVINTDDSVDILKFLRDKFLEDKYEKVTSKINQAKKDLLNPNQMQTCISKSFNCNISLKTACSSYKNMQDEENIEMFKEIATLYKEYKKDNKLYDFDDLLLLFKDMLEDKNVGHLIKKRYQYVFVDEVQDINKIQYSIIKELEGNIFLVGDAKQSIYGFRGSDSKYINERNTYFKDYEEFYLRYNYRSSKKVIELANNFISDFKSWLANNENLICTKDIEGKYEICSEMNEFQQANRISNEIKRIHSKFPEKTIGILLRTNSQSRTIETNFLSNSINYQLLCGFPFFSRRHIRDVISFVKIIEKPNDVISFNRIAQLFPNIGAKSSLKLYNIWAKYEFKYDLIENNIKSELGSSKFAKSALEITNLYCKAKRIDNLKDIIQLYYDDFYKDYLEKTFVEDIEERREDVLGLLDVADKHNTANKFLAYINLLEQNKINDKESKPNVIITTIHKAKGLEYDYVIIPYVNKGIYPFGFSKSQKEVEEEDNVFYVALTRTKEDILLIYVASIFKNGANESIAPSKYIENYIDTNNNQRTSFYQKWGYYK